MCDEAIFDKMRGLQVTVPEITCNPGPYCWCANLSFKAPVMQTEDCLSPHEMLLMYKKEMTEKDVRYLESIRNLKFIRGQNDN